MAGEAPEEPSSRVIAGSGGLARPAFERLEPADPFTVDEYLRNRRFARDRTDNPAPLRVQRARRSTELLSFHRSKPDPVLGIFDDAQYHSSSCELSPGDILLLFTDGLFEVEGPDGQIYDQPRLLRAVSQRAGLCAEELCQQLVDEVQQFAATKEFADDVCLIAMEVDHLMKE